MDDPGKSASPLTFDLFGDLLKYLRRRAQLTQRELAIAVGYSEAHVSRLEKNQRLPDLSTLAALFIPALGLEHDPEIAARLFELAAKARGEHLSQGGKFTVTRAVSKEVIETVEAMEIPSNLPLQLTSFIGREAEIEGIINLLQAQDKNRLVTLLGAGGCGKTRLALQAAKQVAHHYPDGVWFVDLAPLTDSNIVPRITAAVIGVPETNDQPITKNLTDFLRPRTVLIVFDNCEHVLTITSSLIESLLRACPHVRVLATSREVLNVPGEIHFQVSPLPTPPSENSSQRDLISHYDSVRLFIERAQNIQPGFELTDDNASAVAAVCRRLDGIPLAIELAAARINLLRVQQIASRLGDRFNLLGSGRTTLPRHQTLSALIDWSHELLSDEESRLLRRLSVFAEGWSLEAAGAVTNDTDSEANSSHLSTLETLSRLMDKSFIMARRKAGADARYSMLETIRAYALEKLEAAHETTIIRQRHFDFFHKFARNVQLYGAEKQFWLDRLETEQDNIRAALAWSLDVTAWAEKGAELILCIVDFYWFRGFTAEAREWMDKFLAIDMSPSPLRALLLQKSGWFARGSGDFKKADLLLKQALDMAREIGDKNRMAWALLDLGLSAREQGQNERVIPCFLEALECAKESGEIRAIGNSTYMLAETYTIERKFELAVELWEQGLSIFRSEGDKTYIAWGLEGLAGAAYLERDLSRALSFHNESLKYKVEVMDKLGISYSFEGLAQVAAAEEEPQRAAVLWGAASHLRKSMNVSPDLSRQDIYTSLIPQVCEQVGETAFNEAWKKGEAMNIEEAIEYALQN